MSTAAQIMANRQNSQSSTGPRTAEGKTASSQNAVSHGATARTIVLAWESKEDYETRRRAHHARFNPADGVEYVLVDDIVAAEWRMRRMQILIAAHIDRAAFEHPRSE